MNDKGHASSNGRLTPDRSSIPTPEVLLEAFQSLGTIVAVASSFGVSRRTVNRWTRKFGLKPELRPQLRVKRRLSSLLAEAISRTRIAQWIVDEASISVAYNSRTNSTSLLVIGAMNDTGAMEFIAQILSVKLCAGAKPKEGRLPTHILRVQGMKAYCLLGLIMEELTGLKALEAKAALAFFPPVGFIKGKLTTDVYMVGVWRQFATESIDVWNAKRRNKLSPQQLDDLVEAWMRNRTARAKRGISQPGRLEAPALITSATP
jgi:hypothetical protein